MNMQELQIKYPLRFYPVLKQTLWGGNRIVPFLSLDGEKDCNGTSYSSMERVGECWAVSGIEGSVSVVKGGTLDGKSLSDIVGMCGEQLMGKKNALRFGKEFPLLVKFIDAAQDLSVQVHPDDCIAHDRHGCSGKTEMWYIVDSKDNAKLLSGFAEPLTRQQYDNMSARQIVDSLQEYVISEGDMFHLPAGTVHSIGAGAFIVEIQQASDITYRIYDFERKDKDGNYRELHTSFAAEAINFNSSRGCKVEESLQVDETSSNAWDYASKSVDCGHFITSLLSMRNSGEQMRHLAFNYSHLDSFVILTCTSGTCSLLYAGPEAENRIEMKRGDSLLLPADLEGVTFELLPGISCEVLQTHI
jgi:mannose-6-phosphate isomerase